MSGRTSRSSTGGASSSTSTATSRCERGPAETSPPRFLNWHHWRSFSTVGLPFSTASSSQVPAVHGTSTGRALRGSPPLTLVAFDLLCLDGELTTTRPYVERRALLEGLGLTGPCWATTPSFRLPGADVFTACREVGLEGVVAKRLKGRYRPGERSPDWIKIKTPEWRLNHGARRHERPAP
jgi:hypothetical protein